MRYIATIIALMLIYSSSASGQSKNGVPSQGETGYMPGSTIFRYSENLLKGRSWMRTSDFADSFIKDATKKNRKGSSQYHAPQYGDPLPLKKNKLYMLGAADDTSFVFAHSQGIYLGGYRQEPQKPTFIREGIGIDRTIVYGKDDTYKYYIGYYKKNKKHGMGFYVNGKGEMYAGEWKKGRLLRKTKRELTEEEKDKIITYMGTLNHMM